MNDLVRASEFELKYDINTIFPPTQNQYDDLRDELYNYLKKIGIDPDSVDYYGPDDADYFYIAIHGTNYGYDPVDVIGLSLTLYEALTNYENTETPLLKAFIAIHAWVNFDADDFDEMVGDEKLEGFSNMAHHFYAAGYKEKGEVLLGVMIEKFKIVFDREPTPEETKHVKGAIFEAHSLYY